MPQKKKQPKYIDKAVGKTLEYFLMRKWEGNKGKYYLAAHHAGLTAQTLRRLLNGEIKLTVDRLLTFLEVLEISPAVFFNRLKKTRLVSKMVMTND